MWHTHEGMGWWMLFGGGLWMLVLILGFVFVLTLARKAGDRADRHEPAHRDSAIDIARQRYARGEIDREEFEQIRRDLEPRNMREGTPSSA